MSWFKKKLKKITKVADPIGSKLRKSTGGSYGDPMNWYQSKPNTTKPWQPSAPRQLMPQPSGPPPAGANIGGSPGNYSYVSNRFMGQGAPAPGGAPLAGGQNMAQPSGAMMFGGGAPMATGGPVMMGPNVGMQPEAQNPQMQSQRMRIGAIRGSVA